MKQHYATSSENILFESHHDDVDKRTILHNHLMKLDLAVHLSIDVYGNVVTVQGNVLNQDIYQQVIAFFTTISTLEILQEDIVIAT